MIIDTIPLAAFILFLCPPGHRQYDGWFSDDLFLPGGGSNFRVPFFEYAINVLHTRGTNVMSRDENMIVFCVTILYFACVPY